MCGRTDIRGVRAMSRPEVLEDVLDADRLKYCFECGICTATCPVYELIPDIYNPRSLLQRIPADLEGAMKGREIWLCAWCYRCHDRCPQELRIPEILLRLKDMAAESGEYRGLEEALKVLVERVPLPLATLFTCFQPGRGNVEKPEADRLVEKLMDSYLQLTEHEKDSLSPENKGSVAIVGSGPAGLTAAFLLSKMGHRVTVFESLDKPGGMLGWCIPAYRLPRSAVDSEVKRIENLGVEFRTGITIGEDKSLKELTEEFDAVFIAIGAHSCRKLGIEGEDLDGVLDALDFLKGASLGTRIELGDRVIVVGGGDVAMDAARIARIALHLGAKDVKIIYRRSREEMPANPWEVRETEEEGIQIQFLIAPKRVLGKGGRVTGLECIEMRLGKPDRSGRPRPIPIEGSEFVMKADSIVAAIGESPCLFPLPDGVRTSRRNTIVVDPFDLDTGVPGVFAGGDVVRGPSTVIEAVVDGRRVARSIDEYISTRKENEGDANG